MLLDLAEHKNDGFVSLRDISERQGISKKYMEQIVTLLNRPDILRTNRGYQGGYMLAKEPGQYTVGQILRITEGGLLLFHAWRMSQINANAAQPAKPYRYGVASKKS